MIADLDAERAVLGGILSNAVLLDQAEAVIQARHFADQRHRLIYGAIQSLAERGGSPDILTVKAELEAGCDLVAAGGPAYLAGLVDGLPRLVSIESWAGVVRERARRRAALELAQRFAAELAEQSEETDGLLDRMRSALERLADAGERGIRPVADVIPEALRDLEAFARSPRGMQGLGTGLSDLDRLTSGLRPGALYIVAARPGRGKSALCTQIATSAASDGHRVLVFSMEMPPADVVQRMVLAKVGGSRWDVREQRVTWERVGAAAGRVGELPIWFDGREAPTVSEVRAGARRQKTVHGVDLVVVDYLQRLTVDGKVDRWLAVGDSVRALKSLARQLAVPVIAACQLNSDGEDRRPTTANLAQSAGIISAEADLIAFLHPHDLAEWRDGSVPRPSVDLHVDKHRGGPLATVPLIFDRAVTRFYGVTDENWSARTA